MHSGGSAGGPARTRWAVGTSDRGAGASDASDRGATSPIAILLLVALSVVLVGAIGVFVLDLGGSVTEPAPQAKLDASYDESVGEVRFAHAGGDGLDTTGSGTLTVRAQDANSGDVREYAWTGGADGVVRSDGRFVLDDATGAATGNETVPWAYAPGDRVQVVFERGDRSFVLSSYTVGGSAAGLTFSLDPTRERTLWYALDEDDGSGGGSGDPAYARGATLESGKHGDAYAFDGSEHAALRASYASTDAFPELTACAWFQTSEDSTGEFDNWAILDFDRSEYFNLYVLGNGSVGFSTSATAGTGSAVHDQATASTYADGAWHHACAVYADDGTKRIYVDGALEAEVANVHGGDPLGSGTKRYGFIGDGSEASSFDGDRNDLHYTGRVDDVRLYATALSASEVGDASDPATAPTAALERYYPLDDQPSASGGFPIADSEPANGTPSGTSYAFGGASGVHGTAFEFADAERVALQASYDTRGALSEFTTCAWFRTTHTGGGQMENWALLDFDRSEYFNLYVHGDGRVGFSTTSRSGSIDDLYTTGTHNDGDWHLACGVYDDGEKRIVVDGQVDASDSNVHGGAPVGTGAKRYAFIGDGSEASTFDGDRNNVHYSGRVDDVRVYERALDASTTAGMYVRGVDPTSTCTVTTELERFDDPVDPSTLELVDVVATTPGASSVEVVVASDPDGDGDFEQRSASIDAGSAPASVSGLSTDSARYRLEVTLDVDGGDVPTFQSARLRPANGPALEAPAATSGHGSVAGGWNATTSVRLASSPVLDGVGSTLADARHAPERSRDARGARTASLFGASAVRIRQ